MAEGWMSLLQGAPNINNGDIYKAYLDGERNTLENRKKSWDLYQDQKFQAILGNARKPDGSPDWVAIMNQSQRAGLGGKAFEWIQNAQRALNQTELDTVQKRSMLDMYGVPKDQFDTNRGNYETKVESREVPGTGQSTESGIRAGTRMTGEQGHIPTTSDYSGLSSTSSSAPVVPASPLVALETLTGGDQTSQEPQTTVGTEEVFDDWRKRAAQREPDWVTSARAQFAKAKSSRVDDLISRYNTLSRSETSELQKLIGLRGRDVDGRRGPITKSALDAYKDSLATASALSKVKNFPEIYTPEAGVSNEPQTQNPEYSEDGSVKIDLVNKGFSSAAPEGRLPDIDLPVREYTHDDQLQNYHERVWRYAPRGGVLGATGSSEETFTPASPLEWDASSLDDNQLKSILWRLRSDIGPEAADVLTGSPEQQQATVTQLVKDRLQRAIDSVTRPVPVNPLAAFKDGALDYGELAKEQNRYRKESAEYDAAVIKAQQEALASIIGAEEARSALDISRAGNSRAEDANRRAETDQEYALAGQGYAREGKTNPQADLFTRPVSKEEADKVKIIRSAIDDIYSAEESTYVGAYQAAIARAKAEGSLNKDTVIAYLTMMGAPPDATAVLIQSMGRDGSLTGDGYNVLKALTLRGSKPRTDEFKQASLANLAQQLKYYGGAEYTGSSQSGLSGGNIPLPDVASTPETQSSRREQRGDSRSTPRPHTPRSW